MSILNKRHIELVEALNNSKTREEWHRARTMLDGFRYAAEAVVSNYGAFLMSADIYYIEADVDRPMCCGEFLDWTPAGQIGGR